MNFLKRISLLSLFAFAPAFGQQNTLIQTTLSTAINPTVQTFTLASATGVVASFTQSTVLYADREAMLVLSVNGTAVTVQRGQYRTVATPHASGEAVLIGRPDWFFSDSTRAFGGCTLASTYVTPYVDMTAGIQWLCSSITNIWVPGWQNTTEPYGVTAAVASAAGLITPSGPLFHVTGTAAITGFNLPVGFGYGSFTVIPDGIFTTTTANNIALASTAVVGKPLTFTYDTNTAKFYPSY